MLLISRWKRHKYKYGGFEMKYFWGLGWIWKALWGLYLGLVGLLCRSSLWKVLHLRRRPPRPIRIFCLGWIKGSLRLPPWNCRIQRLHSRFQMCFPRIIQWDQIQDRRIAMLLEIQWCPPRTSRGRSKWNNRLVTMAGSMVKLRVN